MFRKALFEDFLMQCKGILQKGCPLRGDKQYEKSVFFLLYLWFARTTVGKKLFQIIIVFVWNFSISNTIHQILIEKNPYPEKINMVSWRIQRLFSLRTLSLWHVP